MYIISFFGGEDGTEKLHLGYSEDGINWTALNAGYSVHTPDGGSGVVRDPFIFRKKDGSFAVVATNDWANPTIYIWDSEDLVSFTNERIPTVSQAEVVGLSGKRAWAPEAVYDPINDEYIIFWSDPKATDGATYANTSKDLQTVSDPFVLFNAGYTIIDASIEKWNGSYYMVFKDERSTGKMILMAKSDSLEPGSFEQYTEAITEQMVEGPFIFKDIEDDVWYHYYDYFNEHKFGVSKTTDLESGAWEFLGKSTTMPTGDVRHGGVIAVTQKELDRIIEGYTPKVVEIGTADELIAIMNNSEKWRDDYKLTADIDLTGLAQTPIGSFTGTFDGQGHTISGINITATADNAGLFGVVGGTASDPVVIKNLTISGQMNGATFSAIGGLVGKVTGSVEIDNVTNKCTVSTTGMQVGGIIGFVSVASGACGNVSIVNTVNDAEISGNQHVGGLVGHVDYNATALTSTFSISKSANYKNVTSNGNINTQIGGIIGYYCFRGDNVDAFFTELYNAGDVSGTKYVGGIMGYANIPVANKISVENVMNIGDITATGGVLGGIMGGTLSGGKDILFQNVYSSGTVTGTGSATYEGVHIGAWRDTSADGNLFYLDNGNANLNTNGSPIAVTAETLLVKDTFASLLEDSAWIYANGIGPELKAFHVHTEVILPAVEPTYTSAGLTEGKKCSGCDEILVAQEEIPALEVEVVTGDIDGDGVVTVKDALDLIRVIVNNQTIENGDINGDGKVGLADVIRVMKLMTK